MLLLRFVTLAVGLFALERQSLAQLFQYQTSPPTFTSPSYANTPLNVTIDLNEVSSDLFFDENLDASGNGTDIVFGQIRVLNLNHNFGGVVISPPIPFDFMIQIGDYGAMTYDAMGVMSPDNFTFDVSGTLAGTIGPGNQMQIIASTYTITPTTQQIGSQDYLLSASYFVPPGPGARDWRFRPSHLGHAPQHSRARHADALELGAGGHGRASLPPLAQQVARDRLKARLSSAPSCPAPDAPPVKRLSSAQPVCDETSLGSSRPGELGSFAFGPAGFGTRFSRQCYRMLL